MKVVKAETILVSIPFESGGLPPWGWGGAPANTFDILLVRLETEDGLVGWGEAFSRMADVALKQLIDTRVLPLVVGRDSRQIARIKHDIEFNLHNFGRSGSIMYGIFGRRHRAVGHRRQARRPAAVQPARRPERA